MREETGNYAALSGLASFRFRRSFFSRLTPRVRSLHHLDRHGTRLPVAVFPPSFLPKIPCYQHRQPDCTNLM
jgi:hypothetical protein